MGLCNISFRSRDADELLFAEDFDLRTSIELRDCLTAAIEAAQRGAAFSAVGGSSKATGIINSIGSNSIE